MLRNSTLLGAGILLGYGAGGVRGLNAEEVKKAAELDVSLYIKISPHNTVHLILQIPKWDKVFKLPKQW